MTVNEQFNHIKQGFNLRKNGVVSDILASMNLPHRIIWGLNLPQIKELAAEVSPSRELSEMLRKDLSTRESVLIAPMLMPPGEVDAEFAERMVAEAPTAESIDILVNTLLRKLPFASELMEKLAASQEPMHRYAAMRLLAGMARRDPERARALARAELDRAEPLTRIPAANIIDDLDFI